MQFWRHWQDTPEEVKLHLFKSKYVFYTLLLRTFMSAANVY